MTIVEALKTNPKIIINTDIDGIFSALILHHYCDCEIAGFCNSAETVWLNEKSIHSIYDGVYIDMFVPRKDVICIDQHIVAVDEEHLGKISLLGTKFNPNLDNPRFHNPSSSYYRKYPFGTVHYIIACLEKNGLIFDLKLDRSVQQNLSFVDLLLRADDAMQTTVSSGYVQNAREWWNWLKDYSNHGKTVEMICDYLYSLTDSDVSTKKNATASLLKNTYHCESPDGGFKNICDADGFLQASVKRYIRFLSEISGLKIFDLDIKLDAKTGKAKRTQLNPQQCQALKQNDQGLFSYAFVKSAAKAESFSYTLM
jgi:hypothetical protein